MKKITYVVLHYKTLSDTKKCVNSILSLNSKNNDVSIVIVDNGSNDTSTKELKELFNNDEKVIILINEYNLGFARGNNVGFSYAKNILKSDFIILLNNDTEILDNEFTNKIVLIYEEEQYYVLGPDIIDNNEGHMNPAGRYILTFRGTWGFEKACKTIINDVKSNYDYYNNKSNTVMFREKEERQQEKVLLHGACLIFSPLYIKMFDGLYDKTFLYMEEDCLKLQMDFYGCKMIYSPELWINHIGSSATNTIVTNQADRIIKGHEHRINSVRAYRKLILKLKLTPRFVIRWVCRKVKKTLEKVNVTRL